MMDDAFSQLQIKLLKIGKNFLAKAQRSQRKANLFLFLRLRHKGFLGGLCVFARDAFLICPG
jgi:hypothetical protein